MLGLVLLARHAQCCTSGGRVHDELFISRTKPRRNTEQSLRTRDMKRGKIGCSCLRRDFKVVSEVHTCTLLALEPLAEQLGASFLESQSCDIIQAPVGAQKLKFVQDHMTHGLQLYRIGGRAAA